MTQPQPTPNDRPAIADLLIHEILKRKEAGIESYGCPLQAFNGRDALADARDEAIDLAKYLVQAIEEKREMDAAIDRVIEVSDELKTVGDTWMAEAMGLDGELKTAIAHLKKLRQQQKPPKK